MTKSTMIVVYHENIVTSGGRRNVEILREAAKKVFFFSGPATKGQVKAETLRKKTF